MTQKHYLDLLLPLQPQMQLVAERLLGGSMEAEDAVQEVFLNLWQRRGDLERATNPGGYAMQMLKNHCVSQLRRRRPTVDIDTLAEMPDEDIAHEAQLIEERAARLDSMMAQLPEPQRRAVEMKYLEEASHQEMQRRLGMSSANVYTTLSRAMANLKRMI